jgi:hypothetical protein
VIWPIRSQICISIWADDHIDVLVAFATPLIVWLAMNRLHLERPVAIQLLEQLRAAMTWVAIAVIAIVAFVLFARGK